MCTTSLVCTTRSPSHAERCREREKVARGGTSDGSVHFLSPRAKGSILLTAVKCCSTTCFYLCLIEYVYVLYYSVDRVDYQICVLRVITCLRCVICVFLECIFLPLNRRRQKRLTGMPVCTCSVSQLILVRTRNACAL